MKFAPPGVELSAARCACLPQWTSGLKTLHVVMQVKPTPPPHFSPSPSVSPPTRAQQLRSAAIHAAMHHNTPSRIATGSPEPNQTRHARRSSAHKQAATGWQMHRHGRQHEEAARPDTEETSEMDSCHLSGRVAASQISAKMLNAADMQEKTEGDAADVQEQTAQAAAAAGVTCENNDCALQHVNSSVASQSAGYLVAATACREEHVLNRLVAVHVRSELTESHFDM